MNRSRSLWAMYFLVAALYYISGPANATYEFSCEGFLELPEAERQMMLKSWVEGARTENQYYRLNALTARVEDALSDLDQSTHTNRVLKTNVGAAITHMKKINSMLLLAIRNREAFFSKVDEYCGRPEIRGATVFEVIPHAIKELAEAKTSFSEK